MKHLFLIKSWITYLVARAILRQEGIDRSDAVLLAVRGFDVEDPGVAVVPLPYGPGEGEPFPKLTKGGVLNYLQTLPRLARFDRFIAKATAGRPFHYYSTNTRQRYNRVITTHPNCRGFSFVECGLISYRSKSEIETIYPSRSAKGRDRTYYRNRIGAKSYYDEGYEHVYGVGALAFPGFERRVELADVFRAPEDSSLPGDFEQIETVLVFDGLSAHRLISLSSVIGATERVFDHLRERGVRRVHYKLHPAQVHAGEDGELETAIRRFAKDIALERLADSVVLEELAHARPRVEFYVNVSSVALYAAQAGSRVWSYARYVAQFEPGFDATIEALPASWRSTVTFLEP